jgi:hypothetical protein
MFVSYTPSTRSFLASGHVTMHSRKFLLQKRKQPLCRTMAHCRPQASFTDSFEETFPSRMLFITKLGPQVSLSPVPFFGVNIYPFNYGIKVILFRNWPQTLDVFKSNLFNTIFPPVIRWSLRSDPNPRSSNFKLKPSMADQALQVNFIPLRSIRYYLSDSHLRFFFRLFLTGAIHRAFDSHWGQLNILFPWSYGNLWSPRAHWSRIQENPLQSSFIRALVVARCFQELAPAPNCRLEKLVQEDTRR